MMKGTGIRLPMTAAKNAAHTGSPAVTPKGMPPRSSTTGTMDTSRVSRNSPAKVSVSHCKFNSMRYQLVSRTFFRYLPV